jgi:hypothetical protein
MLSILSLFTSSVKNIFSFLLVNWKLTLGIILALYLVIITIVCINQHKDLQLAQDKVKNYTQSEKTATTIIKRYVDSTGASHIQINADENKIKQEDIIKGVSKNPTIVDTTAQVLKIAKDKIIELTKINSQLVALNLKAHRDTTKGSTKYVYRDKYADLSFNPIDTTFGFKYNLDLVITKFTKRSGFLGLNRINVLDFSSQDPRVSIQGVQHYSVEQNDPNFGAKLQIKGQFNIKTKDITPAIVGEINYKRFSLEGNYFYNLNTNQRTPTVSLKYDLLKF